MKFITFLNKYFDVETQTNPHPETENKTVLEFWIYEKGEDCEPLLILKNAQNMLCVDGWIIGNIYSSLNNGKLVTEKEFRLMVKKGEVKSIL